MLIAKFEAGVSAAATMTPWLARYRSGELWIPGTAPVPFPQITTGCRSPAAPIARGR
ncbi:MULTISPECIES: hypothetical protein [unclassified Streptomyces]|uniref:hypothetical protein n=1 Tax=unclassified Streptomyces TaxID=2593676 RepID=UPI0036F8CC41